MSWVAAGTAAVGIGVGAWKAHKANQGLKNLAGQPQPQYSMSPELSSYYNRMNEQSQYGFSPTQKAQFGQDMAQQQNTAFRQGVNMSGGNMAQALQVGLGSQRLGALNQFAAQDSALQQQKLQAFGGVVNDVQQQGNLINQNKIQQRTMLEQAYGGALQAGLGDISQGVMSAGSSLAYGQAGKNPYATPPMRMAQGAADYSDWDPSRYDFR